MERDAVTPTSPGEPGGPERAGLHQGWHLLWDASWKHTSQAGQPRSQPLRPQPPPSPLFTQLGQISHRCPHNPVPSLPSPEEFVSHGRGRAINVSPPRVCSVRRDSVFCHHASCCLLPECPGAPGARGQCLPTPGAGARGKSPSSLETVAAPSPGGTRDAAGGDGPCEFGTPCCVCPHEAGVPAGRTPASHPRESPRTESLSHGCAVSTSPGASPRVPRSPWGRARLTPPGGHGHHSPPREPERVPCSQAGRAFLRGGGGKLLGVWGASTEHPASTGHPGARTGHPGARTGYPGARTGHPGASPCALRRGQREPRYHPAVSPQVRAAEGDGGAGKALAFFQHPVRLLWPKSKAFDHLYSVGEKLLENFPVQATLFFYEDSGSEEEEEEEEEEEGDDEEEEATGV
ncbi:hypothetical protein Nmel_013231 [Mimus melanotis]